MDFWSRCRRLRNTARLLSHTSQREIFFNLQYLLLSLPKVATSEYLKTIGGKLAPDIDIMWTGDKVIPKEITVSSLEGITQILRRAPVIWDNEHANDYDQKRVYLG